MHKVFREKREFVARLKPALIMLYSIEDVEYHYFSDKYSEYVRVIYKDGRRDFIAVTGNSLEAILSELTLLVRGKDPTGLIQNEAHKINIDAWFEGANT